MDTSLAYKLMANNITAVYLRETYEQVDWCDCVCVSFHRADWCGIPELAALETISYQVGGKKKKVLTNIQVQLYCQHFKKIIIQHII